MNKKLIRLTESDLHKIVKESVNRILSEMNEGKYVNNKPYQGKDPIAMGKHKERAINRMKHRDPLEVRKQSIDMADKSGNLRGEYSGTLETEKNRKHMMDCGDMSWKDYYKFLARQDDENNGEGGWYGY
jgi:hypothetical protein